ncbi:SCO5918 family protein [Kitasatospora sp. MAP5-34]|uniref:SCO5918 family protein n=1 Tax=Kitasatospora sp. MAP5-34 TaxID=3035102 RepID=UPI002476A91B|nr:SCO5918 family protein [Kitasatospora sp. MAP5-34]MDH6577368.1 hypothetical protein [Kitasatospora sp. MAP5-34]
MRCIIAGYSFDLIMSEVQLLMKGRQPEAITGESVRIGRRVYPVKQVGEAITRQDRRDFSSQDVTRALVRLGFTCDAAPAPATAGPADSAPTQPDSLVLG